MSKKNVPLVVYDELGNRTVIGNCDVEQFRPGAVEISGQITADQYKHLLSYNPDDFSIGFVDFEPVEAVRIERPAIPSNPAFKAKVNFNDD